ncbi:hypothetical protein Dimus_016473 [Dionaea muscipula]
MDAALVHIDITWCLFGWSLACLLALFQEVSSGVSIVDCFYRCFDTLIAAYPAERASPSGSVMPDTVVWLFADGWGLADIGTATGVSNVGVLVFLLHLSVS